MLTSIGFFSQLDVLEAQQHFPASLIVKITAKYSKPFQGPSSHSFLGQDYEQFLKNFKKRPLSFFHKTNQIFS